MDSSILIKVSDIPDYLRSGQLYSNLAEDNTPEASDNIISVPVHCMKTTLSITSLQDLAHALSTLRYWAVDHVPVEIINFILSYGIATIKNSNQLYSNTESKDVTERDLLLLINEYATEFLIIQELINIRKLPVTAWMDEVINTRCSIETIAYLHEKMSIPWDANSSSSIAAIGNVECLRYAMEHGCGWDLSSCPEAAKNGHLDCLIYAYDNGYPLDDNRQSSVLGETCNNAAANGHIKCLQYAREHGCAWWLKTPSCAARGGHLECLIYLHENNCVWTESTIIEASQFNHLDCLRYAHENGCPWNANATMHAALGGSIDCLKYLHENGCPWNASIPMLVAEKGYIECLQYAHQNNCPWDSRTCERAALLGRIECLRYAVSQRCPLSAATCAFAALNNHLECLQYAFENGCPMDFTTCQYAVEKNSVACLRYALRNGCSIGYFQSRNLAKIIGEPVESSSDISIGDESSDEAIPRSQTCPCCIS